MAFKKFHSRGAPREMVQGHWTCADCGKEITELPFTPSPDRPVYCKECWAKRRAEKFNK
jgi:CxxC-x17-CxxC domain-containing protein